jgi:hypothetical protein
MRGVSENFDDWRRSVESSTRVTAGQWLDRIMGW